MGRASAWMTIGMGLGSGCGQPDADFVLTVVPTFLDGQRDPVLNEDPDVKLVLTPPDGAATVYLLGNTAGGELRAEGLPPITADTRVGLALEVAGGPADRIVPDQALAWGEVTVGDALTTGASELEVLVMRPDAVAELGSFSNPQRRLTAAVEMSQDGSLWWFGGGNPASEERLSTSAGIVPLISGDAILRATRTPSGWEEPAQVGTFPEQDLPDAGGDPPVVTTGALAAPAALRVETSDGPRILVSGGRATEAYSSYNSDAWWLLDPESEALTLGSTDLVYERSNHSLLPLGSNRVLHLGGFVQVGVPSTLALETLRVDTGETDTLSGSALPVANIGVMGAPSGARVIVCGGARLASNTIEPVAECASVQQNGDSEPIEPLPVPLYGGAMAALPDGDVLLTGGTDQPFPFDSGASAPATDAAWRWDSQTDSWRDVGPLAGPRAHHRSISRGGEVWLIGGSEEAIGLYGPFGEPVRCLERFDAETDRFESGACGAAGSGYAPGAALGPDGTILVFEGHQDYVDSSGGAAWGVIGPRPPEP